MRESNTTSISRWNAQSKEDKKPWGIIIALLLAVAIHLALFIILQEMNFFKSRQGGEFEEYITTDQVVLDTPVEDLPEVERTAPDLAETQETIAELDDILPELKNQDIDISTQVTEPEVSIQISTAAKMGDLDGVVDDILLSSSSVSPLDDLGTGMMNNTIAAEGQVVLEEGSIDGELLDPTEILDDSVLKGAGGSAIDGVLEGYSSLDALMSMSSVSLQGARTALPSDTLFEYDSADLKSAARFGLLKLCMLIERNPELYCILEGHTDTYGEDSYNKALSEKRAQAVKNYIIGNLDNVGDRVIVRGYGETRPVIMTGTEDEQAPNRRVDILMRKEIPEMKPPLPRPQDTPAPVDPPVKEELPKPIESPIAEPVETPEPAPVVRERRSARELLESRLRPGRRTPAPEPVQPTPQPAPTPAPIPAPVAKPAPQPVVEPSPKPAIIVPEEGVNRAVVVEEVEPQRQPAPIAEPRRINRAEVVEEPVRPKAVLVKPRKNPNTTPPKRAIIVEDPPRAIIVD